MNMEKFSYFKKGVNKTAPAAEATLGKVYAMIRSFRLKELTGYIREGLADKTEVLPSVTFSGTFNPRCDSGLKKYSSLICMDVDHQDYPHLIRDRVCLDRFLNPCLIFISPRGHGLKIIIRIKDGVPENHGMYFDAIALYFKDNYDIDIDGSGRNISRLCFLCHDPEPFWFEDGFVTSGELLKLIPTPIETRHCLVSIPDQDPAAVYFNQTAAAKTNNRTNAGYYFSESFEEYDDNDEIIQLLKNPLVHQHARSALHNAGWKDKKGGRWARPGTDKTSSAVYTYYPPRGCYIFTNFSDNGFPFKCEGYTDIGVISALEFNGNTRECIKSLKSNYPV